jgi:hypothetical protein
MRPTALALSAGNIPPEGVLRHDGRPNQKTPVSSGAATKESVVRHVLAISLALVMGAFI